MPDNLLIPFTGVLDSERPLWSGKSYAPSLATIMSGAYLVVPIGNQFFFQRAIDDKAGNSTTSFFGPYPDSATANTQMLAQKARDGF